MHDTTNTQILILDPRQSGISGDMTVAALTDLFCCQEFTNELLGKICNKAKDLFSLDAQYEVVQTTENGVFGCKLQFEVKKDFGHLHLDVFFNHWRRLLEELNLTPARVEKLFKILDVLVEAEKQVHGKVEASLAEIHFHELNSLDTIIDFTVSQLILEEYGQNLNIMGLPTSVGSGRITFSHGDFSLPVPAVTTILQKTRYPFQQLDYPKELTTPSGLALLTGLVGQPVTHLPKGVVEKTGVGLGQRQDKGLPNFLKTWLMTPFSEKEKDHTQDKCQLMETNLDDVTGEVLGHVMDTFPSIPGVRDVSIYPLVMKKNRPGHCLRLIFDPNVISVEELGLKVMRATGSLGIRSYPVGRHKSMRRTEKVPVSISETNFTCTVKVSYIGSELVQVKPEYEDVRKISEETGQSIIDVQQLVLSVFKNHHRENEG